MTIDQLKRLWEEFADVPVNNDDGIEQKFLDFERGTDRMEIWKWFDDHCPNGLVKDLLGGMPKTGDHPVLEISCWSCSRSRSVPVCLGGKVYCRITGKQINATWLASQPRPDEPCDDYNPSRRSIYACLIDWRRKRQEQKDKESK